MLVPGLPKMNLFLLVILIKTGLHKPIILQQNFHGKNTSPGPYFNSLSYTYNNSTTNIQTGVVNINTFVWDFAEDYNSAVTTTEAGVINNWTRR